MEQSPKIGNLARALCRFQKRSSVIAFDCLAELEKEAEKTEYLYASFTRIVDTVKPVMTGCGLSFSQLIEPDGSVTTVLMHRSGEFMRSRLLIPVEENNPQKLGIAVSYAKRYALCAILGLVTSPEGESNPIVGITHRVSNARPYLTPKLLEKALVRIRNGEKGIYSKTMRAFRVKQEYRIQLERAVNDYASVHSGTSSLTDNQVSMAA
jgi:hypothetical protein